MDTAAQVVVINTWKIVYCFYQLLLKHVDWKLHWWLSSHSLLIGESKTKQNNPHSDYLASPHVVYLVIQLLFSPLPPPLAPNNVPLTTPTCEDRGGDHFALMTPSDSIEADLVFCSRKQAGQGVVGHIAVNHHAVHSTCRRTSVTLILHFSLCVRGILLSQVACVLHHRVNI